MATKEFTATLLQLSRRVDWRFLLPDPVLGNVFCLEPVAPSLAESLHTFTDSLTMLAPQEAGDRRWQESADLLVACDPSTLALSRATALLKPGAHIYIEGKGLLPRFQRRRRPVRVDDAGSGKLWRAQAYRQFLQRLGFLEIEDYWHWPNFERCKKMIPLQDPSAAHLAFDRGGQSVQARLKAGLGRAGVSLGLLAWVVPYFSVIARWEKI